MSKKNQLDNEAVKKMTDEELSVEVTTQRNKHYALRTQTVTEKIEDFSQFKDTKRNIARLLTEQSVRRLKAASK